ncbi:MAG: MFS transporter [Pseudomonadales bacterium]|nr:MFS transporter [Pseudomonadales bacterium]MDP7597677.1 MFS transporter [Pseudomonadales bacterium]HJN50637.1 MFS transporter [Pseudomonadales bacterium]
MNNPGPPSEPKLLNRNFVLLWQGQLVSQIGSQIFGLALLYWILEVTGSATMMGLIMMAASLPGALVGPFGGTLADNLSRKHIIVWTDVIRGIACVGFVAAIWMTDVERALLVLFCAQIVFGLCGAAFGPAMGASIPDLVPGARLQTANSLMQGFSSVFMTLSLAIGGFLYAWVGAPILFLANGISYFISAITESFVRIPQKMPDTPFHLSNAVDRFRSDTLAGLKYVWARSGLRKLFLVAAVLNFVIAPLMIAQPIFIRDFLGRGTEFLGLCGAAQGVGAIIGFAFVGAVKIPRRLRSLTFMCANGAFGTSMILIAWFQDALATLLLLGIFGCAMPIANVMVQTVLQGTTPSEIRGRVLSVLITLATGLMPIAMGLSGILIDWVDQQIPLFWYFCGGTIIVTLIYLACSRDFHEFLNAELTEGQ